METKQLDESFCHSCGAIIKKEAEICPKCGVRQRSSHVSRPSSGKNPWVAGGLNIVWPGVGYLYGGVRKQFGIMIALAYIPALIWTITGTPPSDVWYYIFSFMIVVAFVVDAYQETKDSSSEQ